MRKKFEITNADPPYKPVKLPEPDFKVLTGSSSDFQPGCSTDHKLFITKRAMGSLSKHIGWGETTEFNRVEQGGILLGEVFQDENTGITFGVVEEIIPAQTARGSSTYLEMSHETWKDMLDAVDLMLEKGSRPNLHIIGWYHTHPNNLSVFMSGTDMGTQSRFFFHDWQFAVVVNPQQRVWRAFYGREARECKGFVVAGARIDQQPKPRESAPPPGPTPHAPPLPMNQPPPSIPKRITLIFWGYGVLLLVILLLLLIVIGLQLYTVLQLGGNPFTRYR